MALFALSLETCIVITVAMEKLTATRERCWLYLHINTCFPFLVDGNIFEELEGVVKYFRIELKRSCFFMVFYL